jgi:hypothetical protein
MDINKRCHLKLLYIPNLILSRSKQTNEHNKQIIPQAHLNRYHNENQ